jgi:SET domain-containing protein
MGGLEIRHVSGMGRGVFARRSFKKRSIVEICPVIPLPVNSYRTVAKGILGDYVFTWPGPRQKTRAYSRWTGSCMVLGYGSLYNHAQDPNLYWTARIRAMEMVFWARRDIEYGEHLTHDYGWSVRLLRKLCSNHAGEAAPDRTNNQVPDTHHTSRNGRQKVVERLT